MIEDENFAAIKSLSIFMIWKVYSSMEFNTCLRLDQFQQ